MATFTVRPEGIIRQPALTMPGNATGSEAACTALNASSIRTLLSLGTADSPSFSGLTLTGNLLFSPDLTYNIGAFNATRPKYVIAGCIVPQAGGPGAGAYARGIQFDAGNDAAIFGYTNSSLFLQTGNSGLVAFGLTSGTSPHQFSMTTSGAGHTINSAARFGHYAATSAALVQAAGGLRVRTYDDASYAEVNAASVDHPTAALTLGNSTYGVTVPGAAVVSGDISMSKATQGYIRAYATDGVKNAALYHDGTNARLDSSSGDVYFGAASGLVYAYKAGVNSTIAVYNGSSGNRVLLDPTTVPSIRGQGNLWCIADSGAVVLQGSAGITQVLKSGTNAELRVYDSTTGKYSGLTHDGTNGILSTSSGPLLLQAAAQEVHVYNPGGTASLVVYNSGKTAAISTYHNGTNGVLVTNTGGIVLDPSGSCQVLSATHIQESSGSAEHYIRCSTSTGYSALYLDETTGSGTLTRYNSAWSVAARRGVTRLSATAGIEFGAGNGRYYFGAIDNTRPSITATSTTAAFRLGDDTADAPISCAGITASGVVSHGAYTVATLPAAGSNAGKMAQVTDSNVAASGNYGATVAAGGANRVKVFSDGTNWVIA